MNLSTEKAVLTVFVALGSMMAVWGQLPIPVPGQTPGRGADNPLGRAVGQEAGEADEADVEGAVLSPRPR